MALPGFEVLFAASISAFHEFIQGRKCHHQSSALELVALDWQLGGVLGWLPIYPLQQPEIQILPLIKTANSGVPEYIGQNGRTTCSNWWFGLVGRRLPSSLVSTGPQIPKPIQTTRRTVPVAGRVSYRQKGVPFHHHKCS